MGEIIAFSGGDDDAVGGSIPVRFGVIAPQGGFYVHTLVENSDDVYGLLVGFVKKYHAAILGELEVPLPDVVAGFTKFWPL